MAPQPLQLIGEPTYTKTNLLAYLARKTSFIDLDELITHYYSITAELAARPGYPRLNPVPFIFQAMHETGFLTSWWFKVNYNLAGLGVTGVTIGGKPEIKPPPIGGTDWAWNPAKNLWEQGLIFFSLEAAVRAHLYHALAYVVPGINYGSVADFFNNRYALALAKRQGKPAARVLTDFNGAWAVPGTDYGQRIEAIHAEFAALVGAPPPPAAPQDVIDWIALALATDQLNNISFYQNELFYQMIYNRLSAMQGAGVKSDWATNLEVQAAFFQLRNELVDRANAMYPPIKARLK